MITATGMNTLSSRLRLGARSPGSSSQSWAMNSTGSAAATSFDSMASTPHAHAATVAKARRLGPGAALLSGGRAPLATLAKSNEPRMKRPHRISDRDETYPAVSD